VLIAHSRDDELVPIAHSRELFRLAREPKSFLEMRGSHNAGFIVSGHNYRAGLAQFLAGLDDGEQRPAARDRGQQPSRSQLRS
jgi:fermentation-respiration switch protein FrsA (DUF1100 family)